MIKTFKNLAGWGFGSLFTLMALSAVWTNPVHGIVLAIWAVICLPPLNQVLHRLGLRPPWPLKVGIFLAGFLIMGCAAHPVPPQIAPPPAASHSSGESSQP